MKDAFNREEILARDDLCLAAAACRAVSKLKQRAIKDETFWRLRSQRASYIDGVEARGGYSTVEDAFRGETDCLREMLKPYRLKVEPMEVDLNALTNIAPDTVLALVTVRDHGILHASCFEGVMFDGIVKLSDEEITPEELRVSLMYARNRMGTNGFKITRR